MTSIKRQAMGVLPGTLERLKNLYKFNRTRPGQLVQVGIKPHWTMITGSENECGIAGNITGSLPENNTPSGSLEIEQAKKLIGQPLFKIAVTGINSDNLVMRSLGIAALSALSQHFLSCSSVRKRGYFSECWKATDPFILQYPILSRLVTMDDVVAVIGRSAEIRDLRGNCRELHVIDPRSPDTFSTLLIDSSVRYGSRDLIIHKEMQDTEILHKADVIIVNASTLIDGTFEGLMQHSENARLVGLCGLSGSLIPDVFFNQGVDFITSFRIIDPCRFMDAMINEYNMDYSCMTEQKQFLMMNPSTTAGRPGAQENFSRVSH